MFGWFKKNNSSDDELNSDEINQIIQSFGSLMESMDTLTFYDSTMLKYGKNKTKKAIILAIKLSKDPQMTDFLKMGLQNLVQFQDGIGEKPITKGMDLTSEKPIEEMTDEDLDRIASTISENSAQSEKWESLNQTAKMEYNEALKDLDAS